MKPIDIFIGTYLRQEYTIKTIRYLKDRTTYPYRLFVIDNGGNSDIRNIFNDIHYINLGENMGIHAAWNIALSLAESEYFITSDNDIYVPDLMPDNCICATREKTELDKCPCCGGYDGCIVHKDWLRQLVTYMDERPDYGAISLHPHVFIGAAGIDPKDIEDVKERNMCGAVMRIMRTTAVRLAGGWEHKIEAGRNHEERTICSRLQTTGYKVGICSRIRAFHPFPPNWGYPKEFTPEMQKHNPDLEQYVQAFGNIENYDPNTWLPKGAL